MSSPIGTRLANAYRAVRGLDPVPAAGADDAQALAGSSGEAVPRTTRIMYFPRTDSGIYIDHNSALRSDAFWAGSRYLAESCGKLPWRVTRTERNGTTEPYDRHPTDRVLRLRANRNFSSSKFRETLIIWALHYGNGLAEIERNLQGQVIGLHPIHPEWVRYQYNAAGELEYIVHPPKGPQVTLTSSQVFHIRGFGDGVIGLGVVPYAAQTLGWQQAITKFGATYFSNGVNPSGLLSLENQLTPEGFALFKSEFKENFAGSGNAHEPIILDVPAKFTKFTVQPDESQFVESAGAAVESICRWIGVPPSKVFHMKDAGVRANVEQEAISVVTDSLAPWVCRFEEEAEYKFFRERSGYSTQIDLDAILRGDSKSRAEYYGIMTRNGIFNIDECRLREGKGPVDGGDVHRVQAQMYDIRYLDQALQQPTPPPATLPDPADDVPDE
jgi:HK97 family phage portal protein